MKELCHVPIIVMQQNRNPYIHEMGPLHDIFGNISYSKDARKLRFLVFLYFYPREHMIL